MKCFRGSSMILLPDESAIRRRPRRLDSSDSLTGKSVITVTSRPTTRISPLKEVTSLKSPITNNPISLADLHASSTITSVSVSNNRVSDNDIECEEDCKKYKSATTKTSSPSRTSPRKSVEGFSARVDKLTASTQQSLDQLERRLARQKSPDKTLRLQEEPVVVPDTVPSSENNENPVAMTVDDAKTVPTFQGPISILKRKCSREESNHHTTQPVTFAKNVNHQSRSGIHPGILKKHSSLDEAEILRRRSCSPDVKADTKPILKRRSSLEELVRRAQSPDPQSILKRRESREEDIPEQCCTPPEPQSILKRKISTSAVSGPTHVSIATAITLAAEEMEQESHGVRPILKKASSDEYATADSSSDGTPRPILKKKSDTDDESRPKKTILKSSRKSSNEECYYSDSGRYLGSSERNDGMDSEGRHLAEGRYLGNRAEPLRYDTSADECLKSVPDSESDRENSPRYGTGIRRVDPYEDERRDEVVLRRRPLNYDSSSSVDTELQTVLLKRRSLESSPVMNLARVEERRRSPVRCEEPTSIVLSVADRINRMENVFQQEAKGAVPKTSRIRDKERFKTQPITRDDFHGLTFGTPSKSSDSPSNQAPLQHGQEIARRSSFQRESPSQRETTRSPPPQRETSPPKPTPLPRETPRSPPPRSTNQRETRSPPKLTAPQRQRNETPESTRSPPLRSPIQRDSTRSPPPRSTSQRESTRSPPPRSPIRRESTRSPPPSHILRESTRSPPPPSPNRRESTRSPPPCSPIQRESTRSPPPRSTAQRESTRSPPIRSQDWDMERDDEEDDERPADSVSSKTTIFNQMKDHMKAMAEEAKARRRERTGNKGIARHRERAERDDKDRFQTQPVTLDEVEQAVFLNQKQNDTSAVEGTMSIRAAKEKMFENAQQTLKGILKSGTPGSDRQTPELETISNLRSVLKKESSLDDVISNTDQCEQPRSILKAESIEFLCSDNKSSSSSEEGSESEEETSKPKKPDLSDILYDVEKAHAKRNTPENNKTKALDEESQQNRKNLDKREKENQENVNQRRPNENVVEKKITDEKQRNVLVKQELEKKLMSKKLIDDFNSSRKTLTSERLNGEVTRKVYDRVKVSGDEMSSSADTTSEGESSGGREVKRIIRNEAIARRRQATVNKQRTNGAASSALSKSQSHSAVVPSLGSKSVSPSVLKSYTPTVLRATPKEGDVKAGAMLGLRRSMTQPMEDHDDQEEVKGSSSIAERLAVLQKRGNTGWQKRLPKLKAEDGLSVITANNLINFESRPKSAAPLISDGLRDDAAEGNEGSSLVLDRRGKLETAAQGWKKRVEQTDAVNFSVAGRMKEIRTEVIASPLLPQAERQKKTPRANRFRSKAALANDVKSTPTSPQKELRDSFRFKRSISAPGGDEDTELSLSPVGARVAVPRADNETYTAFFSQAISTTTTTETTVTSDERVEIRDEDLDHVANHVERLLVQKRTVKMQRRKFTSRNPIKALAARTDLYDDYLEVKTGVAEKELRRIQVEKLSKTSNLAVEALAGLASKEDFTAVSLKKSTTPYATAMLPFKELMLLHIKGRRHVQTRLVEPVATSINSGDNYVLVTPNEVYNWVGLYSNVIERSRGAEIALLIQQRKDLGCSTNAVTTITQGKSTCPKSKVDAFWKLLNAATPEPVPAGHPDEDELYESSIVDTNMIYDVVGKELVPLDDYWGAIPKIEMLDPAKVLVFDFGSELYVWSGKNATMESRKMGVSLANELWEEGFDYTECDICPVTAAALLGSRQSVEKTDTGSRPHWSLLSKVNQHMETVLFREKFLDWPDFTRVIRAKGNDDEKQVEGSIEVKPCNAKEMFETDLPEPDLELEGSHLGRGTSYTDEEESRHYEIATHSVTVWHIDEFEHEELASATGQFNAGDSYVVRWLYAVAAVGRELNGKPSRHSMIGRDRCAYFCWQGREASLNEQGSAALITVELDRERGAQLRVVQGNEPPAFLNLFRGKMVVHSGRRHEHRKGGWRLYMCRGETETEAVLVEVACSVRQLRSRGSLVLVHSITGAIYVWHGSKTQAHTRKIARAAAQHLQEHCPEEMGFHSGLKITIKEVSEGKEMNDFFEGLGGGSRQLYRSLHDDKHSFKHTPRLFHLSSVSGTFTSTEIASSYRTNSETVAFPFLQNDLYSANQPTLFLVDNDTELWLWQGWWPDREGLEESGNDATGSGSVRWQAERRAAMKTAIDYWRISRRGKPQAYLVWAGLEPLAFTNLFPMWTDRDDIAELNIRDGRKPGEILLVDNELARLTRSTYPIAQLLQRPLPDGVDPTRLELYLAAQHFQELLDMTKEEFEELPTWKQTKVKKEAGLF